MASPDSRVPRIRAVGSAGKYNVPLRVLHSFQESPGTLVITGDEEESMKQPIVSDIAFSYDGTKPTIRNVPDTPGMVFKVFGPVSAASVEVDVIMQNVAHDNTADSIFTVHCSDYLNALGIPEQATASVNAREAIGDISIAKVSIVGTGMYSHAGVTSRMSETLTRKSINIQVVSTSKIKVSVVIEEKYLELTVHTLRTAFELDVPARQGG